MPQEIEILTLGLKPYAEVWELQRKLQKQLIAGETREHLLICEHYPVITLGTSAKTHNVLADQSVLQQQGVELFKIERGGDVTYHGPGQLVAYPILNLNIRKRDIGWYLRSLEQSVINCLSDFGLASQGICGKTGVWLSPEKKICSIGVRISRWCTMHGLALNVTEQSLKGFSLINPCGFTDIEVTCMQKELQGRQFSIGEVSSRFCHHFGQIF